MQRFKTLLKKWARRYPWRTVKVAISVLLGLAKMSVELFLAEVNMRDIWSEEVLTKATNDPRMSFVKIGIQLPY